MKWGRDRAMGIKADRDIFFGVALNLKEIFFKNSHSFAARAIGTGLDYFQIPYTATHAFGD